MCRNDFTISELQRQRMRNLENELDTTPMSDFTQNLISEKKQEIDYLNQKLHRLRFETAALKYEGALAELVHN